VSGAGWQTGAGAYGTAAILNINGSWLSSARSNSGSVTTYIDYNYQTWVTKALCKNSTPWQLTVWFNYCSRSVYVHTGGQCV
jgi:hypothetical protein